jgi:hypothetical protein
MQNAVLLATVRNVWPGAPALSPPNGLVLTHSTSLRVILSLLAVSQTLSLSNGSLPNPSNG